MFDGGMGKWLPSDGQPQLGRLRVVTASGPPGYPPGKGPVQRGYPPQYEYRPVPPQTGRTPTDDKSETITTVLGAITCLGAVAVFVASFLSWVGENSGIELMTIEAEGFFMIRWGWGGIIFTGFFSLLLGALMVIPAILLFLNRRSGAGWCIVLAVFAFFMALVNIIMVYTTYNNVSAGAGLWLVLVWAVIVLVCGVVALRYTYPA